VSAAEQRFFAICPRGLEAALAEELAAVGATAVQPEGGGVVFQGSLRTAYAANLHSRLASRILWQLASHPYAGEDDLYAAAHEIRWDEHVGARQTLRVDVSATHTPLRSLEFATLRIKDGIVDRLRERTGTRPSIDRVRPEVRVFCHLDATTATLYLDLSGEALFKRGWRLDKGEAPLKENLAAGLLRLAGWTPAQPLLDPFCGSGTIVLEAASIAAKRAPGLDRPFGFERLQSQDRSAWRELKQAALAAVDDRASAQLVGTDISTRVIDQARLNTERAGLRAWLDDGRLRLIAGDARSSEPPAAGGLIITNPPYGVQSEPKSASVASMMAAVGDRLKQSFTGWTAWVLTADRQLPRQMRLQETRKTVLFNGPLECRFFRFELVAGGYRPRAVSHASDR
jgi:putative N6-adenine-specific DNA methylase